MLLQTSTAASALFLLAAGIAIGQTPSPGPGEANVQLNPRDMANWSTGIASEPESSPRNPNTRESESHIDQADAAIEYPQGNVWCGDLGLFDDYEIVQVISSETRTFLVPLKVNNCGEIVFTRDLGWQTTSEIFRYENGTIQQVTNNNIPDAFPDINDAGTIVWTRNFNGDGSNGQIMRLEGGKPVVLGAGCIPSLNSQGHVAWEFSHVKGCAFEMGIEFLDGPESALIFDDGLSNQSAAVNDIDEIVWTNYDFPCGFFDWTSEIMHYVNGVATPLPSNSPTPQVPAIDNLGRVAWDATPVGLEIWEAGVTTVLVAAKTAVPALNDRGDVTYLFKTEFTPWQVFLYRDGQHCRVSNQADIDNIIDNGAQDINNIGEMVWKYNPNGAFFPSGVRYMRRIRSGDHDLDNIVELDDFLGVEDWFGALPECMTGQGDFDRLCDCRFLDMDHNRDVDHFDALMFQNRFARPVPAVDDCCTVHTTPGCNDPATESSVCTFLPDCCNTAWEQECTVLADSSGLSTCFAPGEMVIDVVRDGQSAISVAPGAEVSYQIIATFTDPGHMGLAGFTTDLQLVGQSIDSPADVPVGMETFAGADGLNNPDGFGGSLVNGKLIQIGGLQNTFGNVTGASPFPTGVVVSGLGAGVSFVIAEGTFTAPDELGEYTLRVTNPGANVLESAAPPLSTASSLQHGHASEGHATRPQHGHASESHATRMLSTASGQSTWLTRRIGVRPGGELTITVEPQSPIPATTSWGVVVMLLSLITVRTIVLRPRRAQPQR